MKPLSSSINLSQSLYNALRADYVNRSVTMKREGTAQGLPDIAPDRKSLTQKVIHHGE